MTAARPPAALDGALVVDKPGGLTSHDVVASVRRALGGARVGHTGTLDPMATGVLPLLVGRATRLAQFLAGATKTYDARIRFGWATTTYDAEGGPVGEPIEAVVDPGALARALDAFRGSFAQRPPAFSAKRVDGRRAYDLARADNAPELTPVEVTLHAVDVLGVSGAVADLRLTCSAGFYVRSLAHDLGAALGLGAHLAALRRTASGPFALTQAVALGDLLSDEAAAGRALVPMADLLPALPIVRLDETGVDRVRRGQDVEGDGAGSGAALTRLLTPAGVLAGIAAPADRPGFLHPVVVLM
jgi:tRNA pseudouridine55 synthase